MKARRKAMTTFRGFDLSELAKSFCDVIQDSIPDRTPFQLMYSGFVDEVQGTLVEVFGLSLDDAQSIAVPVAAATVLELCQRLGSERVRAVASVEPAPIDRKAVECGEAPMPEPDDLDARFVTDECAEPFGWDEFLYSNPELDLGAIRSVAALKVGESRTFGGGAAAEWSIRRVR
jgi:hypothetical protein